MIDTSSWNLDFLSKILLEASQTALQMQEDIILYEKTMLGGYLETYTNVDVHIEKLITEKFLNAQSDNLNILGEESVGQIISQTSLSEIFCKDTIIIDPIDGTRNFINKLPNWCISIGLIENFEFIGGAIALPILGEVFISDNTGVYEAKMKSQLSEVDTLQFNEFKMTSAFSKKHFTYSAKHKLPQSKHKYQVDRSCVYSIAKVLAGSYFAYIGQPKIWDLAACIGIFRASNLPVYYYKKDEKKVDILPWKISEEHWKHYISARYPIIFTDTYEHALELVKD